MPIKTVLVYKLIEWMQGGKEMANRGDLLKKVRQSLPVVQKLVYMNTGSVGPLSQFSIQAVQEMR